MSFISRALLSALTTLCVVRGSAAEARILATDDAEQHTVDEALDRILACKDCLDDTRFHQWIQSIRTDRSYNVYVLVIDDVGVTEINYPRFTPVVSWYIRTTMLHEPTWCVWTDAADSLAHEIIHAWRNRNHMDPVEKGRVACQGELRTSQYSNVYRRCNGQCQRLSYGKCGEMPTPPKCACDPTEINGPTSCMSGSGLTCCDKHCVDVNTDSRNCAVCGNVCRGSRVCMSDDLGNHGCGCSPPCAPGYLCGVGGGCVNVHTSSNCSGSVCTGGDCCWYQTEPSFGIAGCYPTANLVLQPGFKCD